MMRPTRILPLAGVVAALALAGCTSDPGTSQPAARPTHSATVAALPAPSADDLNGEVAQALNPAVPAATKAQLLQGTDQDPDLPAKIAEKVSGALDTSLTVTGPVQDNGDGTVTAGFTAHRAGKDNTGTVTFVAEEGHWKLSKDNVCALASLLNVNSAACLR